MRGFGRTGIGMNHINWVQQNEDYNVEYHMIKWKTSHFHEPYSNHMVGSSKIRQGAAGSLPAAQAQTEGEGIGFGLADRNGNGRLRPGLGVENSLVNRLSERGNSRDGVSISARGAAVHEHAEEIARVTAQSMALAETHAAENTITAVTADGSVKEEQERERTAKENTTVSGANRGNIRNRLRESAARLLEAYQRQKKKAAKLLIQQMRKKAPERKEKEGTRQAADREVILSMQAENHYLLDSYDATGNYSILGKK